MEKPNNIPLAARFLPFLIAGLAIILFLIGLFIFSWIFIGAAIIGFILFIISAIRAKLSKQAVHQRTFQEELSEQQGRTIEYENEESNKR